MLASIFNQAMLFKDIIGQEKIKQQLIQNVKNDRISHAQLFVGSEGAGALPLAIAYAQYVLCTNRQADDACGTCPSCKKLRNLSHPDVQFTAPVVNKSSGKSSTLDDYMSIWVEHAPQHSYLNLNDWLKYTNQDSKNAIISLDAGKRININLSKKPFESEYKVCIIWLPEKMNAECANSLLKNIEEPSPHTLIIMASESEEKIISTIRSRCQKITLPPISEADMLQQLRQMPEAQGKNLENLAHVSKGNYNYMLQLLQSEGADEKHELFKELMRFTYGRKYGELFEWTECVSKLGRESQKAFLSYALSQIRENFMHNMKQPELSYLNEEELNFSARFAPFINERNIIPLTAELERALHDIGRNASSNIVFTDLALKVVKLIRR
ncbi:MAG: DNA polymerase III subunit delta' [Mangrovibacterium sp.]